MSDVPSREQRCRLHDRSLFACQDAFVRRELDREQIRACLGQGDVTKRLLDLCGCEGGASAGYQRAGWHVTSVDLDPAALKRNPADVTIVGDALDYLAAHGREYDAIHASFPCQKWSANGANTAADKWPDLITPGRELLEAHRPAVGHGERPQGPPQA